METQSDTGTCHAEVLSIAWLRIHGAKIKKRTKIEMVIFRERADGSMGMAKPCAHCVEKIKKAVYVYGFNIKKVTYTTDDGSFVSCTVDELENDYLTSGTKAIRYRKKVRSVSE